MADDLSNLKPNAMWRNFQELCKIPRPSKHEEKVSKYLAEFGRKLGLETIVDAAGDVLIRKPATPGMENHKGVILQGHMDMVPQKNRDVKHDFLKDPIQPRIVGDRVLATGTTLGADNGIGVAAAMAVLQANDVAHGPLEVLITVDEETGMTGANTLKPGVLKGKILLNLDSEDDDEICIGCAGGMNTVATIPAPKKPLPATFAVFKIEAIDLKGGHSGVDIHLGRANSNKVMTRLLFEAKRDTDLRLISIDGGDIPNGIPRDCIAIAAVPKKSADAFQKKIHEITAQIQAEIRPVDPDFKVKITPAKAKTAMTTQVTDAVLAALYACPQGAFAMVRGMPEVTETSTNLGIVKTEKSVVKTTSLTRSSIDTRKVDVANMVACAFELADAKVVHTGGYSGWTPDLESTTLKTMTRIYRQMFNKDVNVRATHGGLECGIIIAKYPGMDAVSFGTTLKYPHSPDEYVEIPSAQRFWNFLTETLKQL